MPSAQERTSEVCEDYVRSLSHEWVKYREETVALAHVIMGQQKVIDERLSKAWARSSTDLYAHLINSIKAGTNDHLELYFLMTNFGNSIRTGRLLESSVPLSELMDTVTALDKNLRKVDLLLMDIERTLGNDRQDPIVVELCSDWTSCSKEIEEEFSRLWSEGLRTYTDLAQSWKEFYDGAQRIMLSMPRNSRAYFSIVQSWEMLSSQMGHRIAVLMTDGYERLDDLKAHWEQSTKLIAEDINSAFMEVEVDRLCSGMFGGAPTNTPQRPALMGPDQGRTHEEIEDMRKKLRMFEEGFMKAQEPPEDGTRRIVPEIHGVPHIPGFGGGLM
jgi:hypothetical protein